LIHNEFYNAGYYTAEFNGSSFASGIYFYKLIADNKEVAVKKMMLVK
jgi:hypothetical protein